MAHHCYDRCFSIDVRGRDEGLGLGKVRGLGVGRRIDSPKGRSNNGILWLSIPLDGCCRATDR